MVSVNHVRMGAAVVTLKVDKLEFGLLKQGIEKFWVERDRGGVLGKRPYNFEAVKFTYKRQYLYQEFEGAEAGEDGFIISLGDVVKAPFSRGNAIVHDYENMKIGDSRVLERGMSKSTAIGYASVQSFRRRTKLNFEFSIKNLPDGVEVKRLA